METKIYIDILSETWKLRTISQHQNGGGRGKKSGGGKGFRTTIKTHGQNQEGLGSGVCGRNGCRGGEC